MTFWATVKYRHDGWGWSVRPGLSENDVKVVSAFDQARENLLRVVDGVGEPVLWRRIGPTIPSIGNLILHVTGTEHHWIGNKVGKLPLNRQRAAEFDCTGGISLPELLARWKSVHQQTETVLATLAQSQRLMTPYEAHCFSYTTQHFAYHCGQIVTIRKFFAPDYSVYPA